MGGPIGKFAILNFNAFVNLLIPAGIKRDKASREIMQAYRKPLSTRKRRLPSYIFPREILSSRDYLERVRSDLSKISDRPALIVWGDKDIAFKEKERRTFESIFTDHQTKILAGAGHYIQEDAGEEIADAILTWHPAVESG
jgi:haloalkane dehalogenase